MTPHANADDNNKKFNRKPSILLKEEGFLALNQRNCKVYRSFQPAKLYEFKY